MTTPPAQVFDGHNDLLYRLHEAGDPDGTTFLKGRPDGHIDLDRCRKGGFAGGFFAVWVPPPGGGHDLPGGVPVARDHALSASSQMIDIACSLETARPDALCVCRSASEVRAAMRAGAIAAVLHLEGAEAIGPDLEALEDFRARGVRSIGPVWSRPNVFGHGVPLSARGSPDTGPGLTEAGKRLVRACNRLGILVDLSHMNAAGFRDVARISDAPLVVTHAGARALAPSARNLDDWQLDAIRESGGIVGVNFAAAALRPDGRRDPDTPVSLIVRHILYLADRLGVEGVALGSDFDGAVVPSALCGAEGLAAVAAALRQAGLKDAEIRAILSENWLGLIGRVIG